MQTKVIKKFCLLHPVNGFLLHFQQQFQLIHSQSSTHLDLHIFCICFFFTREWPHTHIYILYVYIYGWFNDELMNVTWVMKNSHSNTCSSTIPVSNQPSLPGRQSVSITFRWSLLLLSFSSLSFWCPQSHPPPHNHLSVSRSLKYYICHSSSPDHRLYILDNNVATWL